MNDYEISKLKKELQRKQQLLKEEQQDRQQVERQRVQIAAERDKYYTELLIARKQIENIDKIIDDNVKTMEAKLKEQNFNASKELRELRDKLQGQQLMNQKLTEENRNKDAIIAELSARLREMSKKYKDPSLLVNTKQISEQVMITHNQFYKLTEKYNKLSKDMENIMAENKILRKLHGVPDNFGFDLEEIKIAEKQELQDYKAQCRKLENQIEELEAERTQLRYRLRQYNTLYSNKGDRYKDLTQQQLELVDLYVLNLKEGKFDLPQIDKSQKEMEREILKLRAQVEVLQNKAPMSIMQMNNQNGGNDKASNDQMKKMQEQIKSYLEPFMQDMKKISQTNINGLIQNLQNLQNLQPGHPNEAMMNIPQGGFKGPIPLPAAYNDWSKIKEGYSFLYSSKIPIDLKDLEGDVSFDVVKAKYEIAALQLQNIESLKLLKQKQKVENNLSREIFELKQKYKKCLKVQDELFLRYFKEKDGVNEKIQKLEVDKYQLTNEKKQLEAKLEIVQDALKEMSQKGDLERKLKDSAARLAIAEAEVLKFQRKYQVLDDESKSLKQCYTKLETKLNETERSLREKLTVAKNNERELTTLVNRILEDVKDSVSAEVHNLLLEKMQLMNDKTSHMIDKQSELRLRLQKLEGMERQGNEKTKLIEDLREDNLEIWLELQIVKNRLKLVDPDYRSYVEVLQRFVKYLNQNNTSLMKLFKKFDKDGSGNVTKKEFGDLLKDLNFKMTPAQLDLLFMEFDVDGSEQITYKEFIKKMRRAGAMSRTKEEDSVLRLFKAIKQSNVSIKRAFQIIDDDKSGEITKAEMQRAFSQIGITTTAETVNYLFKLCDYNNDGKITEAQLTNLYNQMVRDAGQIEDEIYGDEMDWKLAFVLKLEEVSLKFNSTLLQTFKKLDDDGNSILTMTELIEFVKRSQMQVDSSALKELFDFLDRRRDGKVEYGEFLKVLAEAKAEKMRIERINFVKKRTQQLKVESQKMIASQKNLENFSSVNKTNEIQKMKIKIEGMTSKHTNLLKKNEEIAKMLAQSEQRVKELIRTLEIERTEKQNNLDLYYKERLAKVTEKGISDDKKSDDAVTLLKKELNELKIRNTEITNDLELYKNLYEGLTDKNKAEQLKLGKLQAECKKYYDIVKQLQSVSESNAELGKLYIQLEYSKRNEEIVNSKYEKIVEELRKVDGETKKLSMISAQKEKEIINTHLFFQEKCKLQQLKIDGYALKIIPAITMQKMQDYLIKLRSISNSKSSLEQENLKLRESNYNLQARNDYVENQRVHIAELQRKLRSQYSDDSSKTIIDLTKKLSDYKMSELKAKREMNLLKEKEEYYVRIHNTHNDNIKELEEELQNWEAKYNEREEFWRKRLSDQIKLMEEFQRQANKAKQQQITAMNYFNQKKEQQQTVNRKYQELNPNNFNNISQFIKHDQQSGGNQGHHDDEYTEQLLDKMAKLQQQLMEKEREIHHFKSAVKDIIPENSMNKLMDFGSQMNVSTNSFVMQTELTSSQLKSNARRFLNSQKQVESYYKEENARITQAAQQSIQTLQRIIDDKNEQLRKKQRMIQDLKKQFNETVEKDCLDIQKLHEQIRELRSKSELNNINQLMSRTTKNNFYPTSKAQTKLEEYQQQLNAKDIEIRSLQDKYDKLLITKTSAQNQKTAAKNAVNSEKLKQKLQELTFERENQKKKFQEKELLLQKQITKLNKIVNEKTKKIEQLNSALKDIKEDIINEKNSLSQPEAEKNLKTFVENMSKGTNKNDAVMEQYMQSALVKIKQLENDNRDLKDQLNKAKDVASKTASRFGR